MSKIKLLLDVVSDLRSLADSLQAVADAMTQDEPAEVPTAKSGMKAKKAEAKPAPEPVPEEKPLTLEKVRAVLAEKSRAGHTAEAKALLIKHGADKLSDIDPVEYQALLADAEVL
ncbi:MAG: rRNA biogenesis protein rrp5 [Eubacteriales bacterium]|nr:rRNA biogenesis protein rrp5 [Eubacteriales bacterium]